MPFPKWVKTQLKEIKNLQQYFKNRNINTVCETLRCPNRSFCYKQPTATFMILGNVCTRKCKFCEAEKGKPSELDKSEPERIAIAVKELCLKYVVVTSPTRDDLSDGGAEHFSLTVQKIKELTPDTFIETLVPDFQGSIDSIRKVVNSEIVVFAHNIETVKRLYDYVRDADYARSLKIIETAKKINPKIITKSGFMIGLGETPQEASQILKDLKNAGCDIVTVGQYLQPSKKALPVVEYILPERFDEIAEEASKVGIKVTLSGPLIRSSTRASEAYLLAKKG